MQGDGNQVTEHPPDAFANCNLRKSSTPTPCRAASARTKDLVDMVLLIRGKRLDKAKTAAAIRVTFAKRETHAVPQELDPPPTAWEPVFDALAKECGVVIKIQEGFATVREFARTLET